MPKETLKSWKYEGSASVAGGIESGLSIVTVHGLITQKSIGPLLADNAKWLAHTGVHGQIARYEQSAIALAGESMLQAAELALVANPAFEVPTAIIVHADMLDLFRRYSYIMNAKGVSRAAFSDADQARRWVQREAALYRAVLATLPKGVFVASSPHPSPPGDGHAPSGTASGVRPAGRGAAETRPSESEDSGPGELR